MLTRYESSAMGLNSMAPALFYANDQKELTSIT